MLTLQLREIGSTLSDKDLPALDPALPPQDDRNAWRDSSNDLEEGLDVLELPVDLVSCEAVEPLAASSPGAPPRE